MEKFNKQIIFLIVGFLLFTASPAVAAVLNFSPGAGSYAVGNTFSVSVYVSSVDQSMNAASGVISFPQDKLEVISLSRDGSVFDLWVEDPSFSNSSGKISFEGIAMNPGFTGNNGKIITVNLKVKSAGTANLIFSSGSVLANDGKGTNILEKLGSAGFDFLTTIPDASEATTPSEITGTPLAPKIISSTHPDPTAWYANKNPEFSWEVASGVTAVRLLYDKYPNSTPAVVYSPPISGKKILGIEDGIYYLHVQFRNSKGWGGISHFRFQVDTEAPKKFNVVFPHGIKSEDPRPVALFNTNDSLSGISYYEIKIGEGDILRVDPHEIDSNPYGVPTQEPGKKTIIVAAFDKAGNKTTSVGEFEVDPISTPKITSYQETLTADEIFIVTGETYADAKVTISIKDERGEVQSRDTMSNSSGYFKVIWPKKITNGVYELSVHVTDNRGAKSLESSPLIFKSEPSKFLVIGGQAVAVLAIIIPLLVLIFAIVFIFWYGCRKFYFFKKRLHREVYESEAVLQEEFVLLRENIQKQIKMLEKARLKRRLTGEEEKIVEQLNKNLDAAEKSVKKEIKDIEKEIE